MKCIHDCAGRMASKLVLAMALVAVLLVGLGGIATAAQAPSATNLAGTPTPGIPVSRKAAAPKQVVAPKPAQGKIALMTAAGGDILLLDPVMGKLERLTDGMDPAFSPDGTQLAFTRWGIDPGVYVRDLKTGTERQVAPAQKPRHVSWSSDGQKLAFVRLVKLLTCRESVIGCYPEEQLRSLFGGRDCINWLTDKLCISRMPIVETDQTGLVEVGLDGQGQQDIPAPVDAQSVSWRPNSHDLLYRGNNRLQVVGGPDQRPWDVTQDQWWGSPIWSPDGTQFLAQQRLGDHTDIGLFDGSGRLLKYLTAPPSALQRNPQNVAPTWSADGKTILFLTDREGEGNWKLYRMNSDGSGQAPFMPNALKDVKFRYDFSAERVASWGK